MSLTHLQLIPADNVSALYYEDTKTLVLKASGTQVDITRDIHFHRLPWPGALRFKLQGLVGPIIRNSSPFSARSNFKIDLPSRVFPSNTAVIDTANKKGLVVPITYILKDGSEDTNISAKGDAPSDLPEVKETASDDEIVALFKEPFTIKQSDAFKGEGGSINISFDKTFLVLTDAAIYDGKIEWTFNSQQTGNTEVSVYLPGGPVTPSTLASFSVTPANGTNSSKKDAGPVGIPLSWDGVINIGYDLIRDQYPDAKLYEVDAKPATSEPVSTEWGLVQNRIVCGLPDNKTAIIQSHGWDSFGPVEVIDAPWLDDIAIRWPVPLDIHEAFVILRSSGYEEPVWAVTLRQPLYPGIDQPFYIFNIGSQFIAVGIRDKQIHKFGPTGREY
ncbi:hypothetical protein B0T10DRAFT_576354 [Thelonectria olida]|uniref:Uncharacterized protein n=1 Tax=Thelonectria olida TaxID=1576542 RepID=A0A9P9AGW1_9HYPO|nr:hypothetical protein B0T10DRAFT_576354 [Thelonectria olida]